LQLWDFGGEDRFRFLLPKYVSGSSGGIFMYDITRYSTLKNVEDWLEIFREEYTAKKQPGETLPIIMVGGKKDLEDKRSIPRTEAKRFVRTQNLFAYDECSAKTGENVELIFEELSRDLLRRINMI